MAVLHDCLSSLGAELVQASQRGWKRSHRVQADARAVHILPLAADLDVRRATVQPESVDSYRAFALLSRVINLERQ